MQLKASVYREVTKHYVCPMGVKALALLKRYGYSVADHPLTSSDDAQQFKRYQGVNSTPQTFIHGERIGNYEELRAYLGLDTTPERNSATLLLLTLLLMAALFAFGFSVKPAGPYTVWLEFSINLLASILCLLALLKVQHLTGFADQFITYDLLAMRFPRYAYLYPFVQIWVGFCNLLDKPLWAITVAVPLVLISFASLIKVVFYDWRLFPNFSGPTVNIRTWLSFMLFEHSLLVALLGLAFWAWLN